MKSIGSILVLPSLILAISYCGIAQEWQKIVPLKSTRADVEALFGPNQDDHLAIYQLKEGSLSIEYSSGPCRPERKGGWNVPENVVVSVTFSPRSKKRVGDLKLDPKRFRKVIDQHVIGITYYINDEDGINYAVQQGRVDYVEYGPPKKYDYLYCGDPEGK